MLFDLLPFSTMLKRHLLKLSLPHGQRRSLFLRPGLGRSELLACFLVHELLLVDRVREQVYLLFHLLHNLCALFIMLFHGRGLIKLISKNFRQLFIS